MSNTYIKSSQHTRWSSQREAVSQPNGIDYEQLLKSIGSEEKSENIKKESSVSRKDLRKRSFVEDEHKDDETLKGIDKDSLIPIPGMLIELENTNSDTRPPDSDWIAPHGNQWGPMTL